MAHDGKKVDGPRSLWPIFSAVYPASNTSASVYTRIDLELFKAGDVMRSPVVSVTSRQSLHFLATILLETTYNGFPVVEVNNETGEDVFSGLITRFMWIIVVVINSIR